MREVHGLKWWRDEEKIARETAAQYRDVFPPITRRTARRAQESRRRIAAITRRRPLR